MATTDLNLDGWLDGPIEIIPAVDVLGASAVRLHQGDYDAIVADATWYASPNATTAPRASSNQHPAPLGVLAIATICADDPSGAVGARCAAPKARTAPWLVTVKYPSPFGIAATATVSRGAAPRSGASPKAMVRPSSSTSQ